MSVLKCVRKTCSKEVKKSTPISYVDVAKLVLDLDLDSFKDLRTAARIIMIFNLMGRFFDIQMVRVRHVEVVQSGLLKVKIVSAKNKESYEAMTLYMVCNPDGLVFCVGIVKKYFG